MKEEEIKILKKVFKFENNTYMSDKDLLYILEYNYIQNQCYNLLQKLEYTYCKDTKYSLEKIKKYYNFLKYKYELKQLQKNTSSKISKVIYNLIWNYLEKF